MFSYRAIYSYLLIICLLLLGIAADLQYLKDIHPCLLCMVERAIVLVLALALVAACLHNHNAISKKIYNSIILLISLCGLAVSSRHIWLQHLPAKTTAYCVPDYRYFANTSWLTWLKYAFNGTSECTQIIWHFGGLTMPQWLLGFFIACSIIAVWQFKR